MPVRRNTRGKWIYRKMVVLADGTKIRIFGTPRINTKIEAEKAERAHIERVERGGPVRPVPAVSKEREVPKFEEFAEQFMAIAKTKNKPSEVDTKDMILRVHLKPAFGRQRLDQIGYAEVQDYAAQKTEAKGDKRGLSKKTVNNHLTVLRRMLMVAKKRGLIDSVPEIEWLKAPKPEFDFFDFDEAGRLVKGADGEWRGVIVLALRTGLRQG